MGSIIPAAKLAYYCGPGMVPGLAARYYRAFEGARTILDVGCGRGDFGRLRPSPHIDVNGIDIDAGAVAHASRFERARCLDIEREPLPYDDGVFDGILAKDIFEHLQDPAFVAREAYRVARAGAVIVASVVMARPTCVWADYTHVRGFTRASACMLLEDAGFEVENVWRMGPVPLSSRLHLIDVVPHLLRLPVLDKLWATSWELKARK